MNFDDRDDCVYMQCNAVSAILKVTSSKFWPESSMDKKAHFEMFRNNLRSDVFKHTNVKELYRFLKIVYENKNISINDGNIIGYIHPIWKDLFFMLRNYYEIKSKLDILLNEN